MTRDLAVVLGGTAVAEVVRTRAGALRLTYNGDGDGTPLSLSLAPAIPSHVGEPVRRFLDGLLPEDDRVRSAVGRTHGVDPGDPLDMLSAIGKDCAGAVQLCAPAEVPEVLARAGSLEPVSDGLIEARLDELELDEGASWAMADEHWSLAGTQGKLALRRADDRWCLAHGSEPTTHILKPGVRRLRAQALVEHVSMRAAALLGLDVAATQLRTFRSQTAVVVTRFDRALSADGSVVRRHQEDLCQALGATEKYEEYGGPSVTQIAALLREASATAAAARANVERFLDGVVYNALIGAPDAHARNYAVLLDQDEVTLAPLYDVASGLAYDAPAGGRVASMSVGGTFELAAMDDAAWRRLAEGLRVDAEHLLERRRDFAGAVLDATATALSEIGDDVDDVDTVRGRLLDGLAAHLDVVVGGKERGRGA